MARKECLSGSNHPSNIVDLKGKKREWTTTKKVEDRHLMMLRSCCLTANIGKYCLCSRRLFFLANSLRASVFSFMCSANFCSALEHQGENMNKTCCHNSHAKIVCWANTWRLHTCSPLCHPLQQACLHRYLLPPSSLCPWCPPALCQPVPSVYAEPGNIIMKHNLSN